MRKLILQMQSSIDGYVADQNGSVDWMQWNWGPEWTWPKALQEYHTETVSSADEVLLSGAMTAEGFIDHWAEVARDLSNPEARFATAITRAHKTIFSLSPFSSHWANTNVATRDLASEVAALKSRPGKNIIAFGGAGFAASLLRENLVDELHLVVNPVTLGAGLVIFDIGRRINFSLLGAIEHDSGLVVLRYAAKS